MLASVSAPDSGSFLEVTYWKIRGRLDPAALKQACSRVQARHAVLRTCFAWKSRAEPVQVVLRYAPLPFTARDLVQTATGGTMGGYRDRMAVFKTAPSISPGHRCFVWFSPASEKKNGAWSGVTITL